MDQPLPTELAPPAPAPVPAGAVPVPLDDPGAFSIGGVISRTLRLWWQGGLGFLALGAIAHVPSAIGSYLLHAHHPELVVGGAPEEFIGASPRDVLSMVAGRMVGTGKVQLPYVLVAMALSMAVAGAVVHVSERRLLGERPGLGAGIAAGLRAWPALLGVMMLGWLASIPALLALIFPAVILGLGWCLALPLIVNERLAPVAALTRSWRLTAGYKGHLLVAFVAVWAALTVGLMVVQLPYGLYLGLQSARTGVFVDAAALAVPTAVLTLVSGAAQTLLFVAPAVAYRALREAKEGRDPAVLGQVFE